MTFNLSNNFLKFFLIFIVLFFCYSCGGSGSGAGAQLTETEQANLSTISGVVGSGDGSSSSQSGNAVMLNVNQVSGFAPFQEITCEATLVDGTMCGSDETNADGFF